VENQEIVAPDQHESATEFVGYGPAAAYLGLQRNTLSSYVARGIGPKVKTGKNGKAVRQEQGQYLLPVFTRADLDAWRDARPGQGARTDLSPAAV
jgi:hypothetical protein